MHRNLTEELSIEDYKLDLENRIRNLLWTVSGDYTLDVKPDVSLFLRSKEIALYDGIKQGAFARYFDKNLLGIVKHTFINFRYWHSLSFCLIGKYGILSHSAFYGTDHYAFDKKLLNKRIYNKQRYNRNNDGAVFKRL